jgi:hypothetical protein
MVVMPMREFATAFFDASGKTIAGTWFDNACGWRVSTIPALAFRSEATAITFFQLHCDAETGMLRNAAQA